jgi:NAD-dependent deacetylase
LLGDAGSLLFITGAGVSAESGLPTYRGIGGLYEREVTDEGLPIEEILSGAMMRRRPELTWKYLAQVAEASRGAKYNRAHKVIAEMEAHFDRVWTLTQNVDGFHREAGSQNVIDIHGDMHELLCPRCGFRMRIEKPEDVEPLGVPPQCPECEFVLRPDVILFGELLPMDKLGQLYQELEAGFDVVFTIGTTSVFPYIAEPVATARRAGKPTVEINPGESEVSYLVDVKISLGAAVTLDAIWTEFQAASAQ